MRVMQSPWGMTLMVIASVLSGLLAISIITVLFALALFFVRRSRWPVRNP
jgi:hypothetical protein